MVMDIQNLLHFYLIGLVCYLSFFIVSIIQGNKEVIMRALSLLILLHLILLAIYQGVLGWNIFVGCILMLGIYELSQQYPISRIFLGVVTLIVFVTGLYTQSQFIEFATPGFILMSFVTFNSQQELVQKPRYLFAFSLFVLVLGSIFLANLIKISPGSLLAILFLIQFNDNIGYMFGKKFGKTHLFPETSPGKTLEGYLFAGVGLILAIILLHTYIPVLHTSLLQDAILLFVIWIVGNLGDLLFSSLKRKLEIKDFSEILPGHGGILDRFDSILSTAPFFYILINHGFPIF